ncbi:MAG: folate-binding protein YgfZ [Pseudomonadota bacterium]|nr:folate-binding protein YgfZ [Pseudomonadota bacterium]MDE3037395.1 folate-binding protein YgfZ [Pseudomonadota bacterium]
MISVSGNDRFDFLQGLVSNDVRQLAEHRAVYAALLSPQGKFLHDFFLIKSGDVILIDSDKAQLPALLQRLAMYILRSKVMVEAMPQISVAAAWRIAESGNQGIGEQYFSDPRLPALGWRMVGTAAAIEKACAAAGMEPSDEKACDRTRLNLGVPDGARDMIPGKSLLLEFGFEDLHGVDFAKGCYVGQEVTARSKHRGQVRRFIYRVRAASGNLPPPGTPVTLEGAIAGEMRSSLDNVGLALLRVEAVQKADAGDMEFHCGHMALKASLPQWVTHPPKALAVEG